MTAKTAIILGYTSDIGRELKLRLLRDGWDVIEISLRNLLRIDENDHFSLLLATAQFDTIGAITVKPFEKEGNE